jgi:HK97 family phage major capsid protein
MAENVYLRTLREQYEALKKSINGLQVRAAEGKRDLTTEELRSVVEMGEKAKAIFDQITDLSDIALRDAKVEAMNGQVDAALRSGIQPDNAIGAAAAGDSDQGAGTDQFRGLGGAHTQDRDPGFYIRGGQHSFVGDQWRSKTMGDNSAAERLLRHSNALKDNQHLRDVLGAGASTGGAGLVPPVWLAEQFAPILHRKLRVAAQLQQVPWAGPFAWSIPVAGTVAKTSSVAEGVNTTETDPGYTVLTVTPKAIMGYSEVSRQMLEGSNPAVDAIIWADLMGDFYDNCELEVIAAAVAQSGVNTVTVSAGAASTTDILAQRSGILDGISAISDNSAGDADIFFGRTSRWTTYLKMQDTAGRPLILAQAYNPQNAIGQGGATQGFRSPVQGSLENLAAVTSPTVAASTGFIANSQEHLFSVSPPMQFSFEQPAGPALIRVGVWGYEAVTFGRRPKALTKITYSGS